MRIDYLEWNKTNPMHASLKVNASNARGPQGRVNLDKHQIQASAWELSYFTSKSKCKLINLIHTR